MQYAADKFERTEPAEFKRVPFSVDEAQIVPGAVEAIGWAFLALCAGALFVGFLGM